MLDVWWVNTVKRVIFGAAVALWRQVAFLRWQSHCDSHTAEAKACVIRGKLQFLSSTTQHPRKPAACCTYDRTISLSVPMVTPGDDMLAGRRSSNLRHCLCVIASALMTCQIVEPNSAADLARYRTAYGRMTCESNQNHRRKIEDMRKEEARHLEPRMMLVEQMRAYDAAATSL